MLILCRTLLLAALGTLAAQTIAAPVQYTIQTVPALPAANPRSQLNAINSSGLGVGLSNITGNSEAITWDGSTLTSLGNLGLGGGFTSASGINDAGQIVGLGSTQPTPGTFVDRAYVWFGGTFTTVDPSGTGTASSLSAINNSGVAVGSFIHTPTNRQAYRYDSSTNTITTLGFLPGGNRSFANAINDAGVIGGASRIASSGSSFATRWIDGVAEALTNPAGATSSNVFGINNAGLLVGQSTVSSVSQATLWDASGLPSVLPFLAGGSFSLANDINNLNQIVGFSTAAGGATNRATLWQDGVAYDLNTLLIGPSDFTNLIEARAINDSGVIVGFGTLATGGIRGFVLTPIPSPGTAAMFAAAGLFASRRRRS